MPKETKNSPIKPHAPAGSPSRNAGGAIAGTHSQDADRHRGVKHPVSEK